MDADGDLLPDDCDPDPNTKSPPSPQPNPSGTGCKFGNMGPDEDQDCYSNGQDNCPLVPNGVDQDGDPIGTNNQADMDGDGIGDACDSTPTVFSGEWSLACNVVTVTIGSPSGSPPPFDCEGQRGGGVGGE